MKQKHKIEWNGNTYYYLGMDKRGINYYMKDFTWDCEWYWSGGWIESFNNNDEPEKSSDIDSHTHFDMLMFKDPKLCFYNFNEIFVSSPFDSDDIWKLCELMKEFYLLRDYAKFCKFGYCGISIQIGYDDNINMQTYENINKLIMPKLFNKIRKVLTK